VRRKTAGILSFYSERARGVSLRYPLAGVAWRALEAAAVRSDGNAVEAVWQAWLRRPDDQRWELLCRCCGFEQRLVGFCGPETLLTWGPVQEQETYSLVSWRVHPPALSEAAAVPWDAVYPRLLPASRILVHPQADGPARRPRRPHAGPGQPIRTAPARDGRVPAGRATSSTAAARVRLTCRTGQLTGIR
jgi:hypothetical protein